MGIHQVFLAYFSKSNVKSHLIFTIIHHRNHSFPKLLPTSENFVEILNLVKDHNFLKSSISKNFIEFGYFENFSKFWAYPQNFKSFFKLPINFINFSGYLHSFQHVVGGKGELRHATSHIVGRYVLE